MGIGVTSKWECEVKINLICKSSSCARLWAPYLFIEKKIFSASTLSDRKWRERSDADKRGESKKQQKVPDAATFGRFGRHLFPFINSASTTDVAAEVLIANEHKHRDEWEEIWIFFTFCWFGDNNVVIRHCSVCFLLIYRCAAAVDASFSCSSSSRHHSPI